MKNESSLERLEDLAKVAFEEGDLPLAQNLLVEASMADSPGPSVFANLGLVCLDLGDYRRAIQTYSAMPTLEIEQRVNRGLAYDRMGDAGSARADYQAALGLDRDDVAALINLGTLELSAGSLDLARELLERAYEIDRTAGWQLSEILRACENIEGAVDALNAAITAGEFRAYLDLADVERERGNLDASSAAHDAAIAAGLVDID